MMDFHWAKACCIKTLQYTKRISLWLQLLSTFVSLQKWDVLHNNKNILYIDVEMKEFLRQPIVVN